MELVDQNALPMPDDLDTEEQSPYLRRKKLVPVRRSRFSRRWRVVLFVLLVLLPVGFAGYALATFALNSPLFVLASPDDIVVAGNHYVSREEVLGALELPLTRDPKTGTNIFRISLEAMRRKVETLSWVHTATITRILPHELVVHISERTPIAYANMAGQVSLIDEDGMLLEKTGGAGFDLPVVYGLEGSARIEDRRVRLALYREFMRELGTEAPRAGWMVSEIYVSDAEDLKAVLTCGSEAVNVHFGEGDFLQRFQRFIAALPEMQKLGAKLHSVDLRYRDQVILDPPPSEAAAKPEVPGRRRRKGIIKDWHARTNILLDLTWGASRPAHWSVSRIRRADWKWQGWAWQSPGGGAKG